MMLLLPKAQIKTCARAVAPAHVMVVSKRRKNKGFSRELSEIVVLLWRDQALNTGEQFVLGHLVESDVVIVGFNNG
jgi:hypothetical protein